MGLLFGGGGGGDPRFPGGLPVGQFAPIDVTTVMPTAAASDPSPAMVGPKTFTNFGGASLRNYFDPNDDKTFIFPQNNYAQTPEHQSLTNEQRQFIDALQKNVMNPGTAPSAAATMLQGAQDQDVASQYALANSANGGANQALGLRTAMGNVANSNAMNQRAQIAARLQEQQANMGALNQAYGASFQNQNNVSQNTMRGIEQQAMENARRDALKQHIDQSSQDNTGRWISAGIGAAGALGAAAVMSDKNEKKDIQPEKISSDGDLYSFLDKLKAYNYKYKDSSNGEGVQHSVMAQDLEKSPVGKSMVEETDDGKKMVDYGKGFGAILAAQAQLHDRLKKLEGK